VGRLNPDSAYSRFFPDQFPVDGTRMPTLREVVRLAVKATGKKIGFQIEMKTNPARPDYSPPPEVFAAAVYKVLKEEGIVDRVEVHAFDFRCLYELQKLDSASRPPTSRRATMSRGERTASSPRTRRPPAFGRGASS